MEIAKFIPRLGVSALISVIQERCSVVGVHNIAALGVRAASVFGLELNGSRREIIIVFGAILLLMVSIKLTVSRVGGHAAACGRAVVGGLWGRSRVVDPGHTIIKI